MYKNVSVTDVVAGDAKDVAAGDDQEFVSEIVYCDGELPRFFKELRGDVYLEVDLCRPAICVAVENGRGWKK